MSGTLDVCAISQDSLNILNAPSVLEIAAKIVAGYRSGNGYNHNSKTIVEWALNDAEALIELYNERAKNKETHG